MSSVGDAVSQRSLAQGDKGLKDSSYWEIQTILNGQKFLNFPGLSKGDKKKTLDDFPVKRKWFALILENNDEE